MKPEWIARQSRRPAGWLGEVVARVMARETRGANTFALDQVEIEPSDAVLEVGSGHGETLLTVARRAASGFAAGIDPSDVMVRLAARRLRREIRRGRVEVRQAEAARIPFDDARFDVALAVHVLYFWPEPAIELREIRRVLRPGGTLLLGFRPDGAEARASLPGSVYHLRSIQEVEKLLRETGYETMRVAEAPRGGAPFACVVARALSATESSAREARVLRSARSPHPS
jgi:ubiquinone/menaquinone biosynthesis C-methylase UbiE